MPQNSGLRADFNTDEYHTIATKAELNAEIEARIEGDNNLQSEIARVENEIPDISGLATKTELQAVENEIPDISNLATKTELQEVEESIPIVNNGTLTIIQNGETKGVFRANDSNNVTVNLEAGGGGGAVDSVNGQTGDVVLTASDVGALPNTTVIPTKTSDLTNDSGYITNSALSGYATETFVTSQGYITGITSSDVTTALGYTPYNSSNPNGYTSNIGTVTSVNNVQPDTNGNVTLNIPQPTIDDAISTISTNAVQNKAIPSYIVSRGQNLVSNGFATLGNNYNFSTLTYTGADTYGAGGCFYYTSDASGRVRSDEYMPIDITQSYKLSYAVKNTTLTSTYDFIDMYDIDLNRIAAGNCGFTAGTTTTLAQDLKNGDTVIYFTDLSNWNTTSTSQYLRALIFWKYKNSFGYEYPTEYYSRYWWYNLWDDSSVAIDKVNNTITLKSAWNHGTFEAGHPVSQGTLSGANVYGNSNYQPTPNEWTVKTYTFDPSKYRNATAYIQLGWLTNYSNQTDNTFSVSSISFTSNVDLKQFADTCGNIEAALNTIRGV